MTALLGVLAAIVVVYMAASPGIRMLFWSWLAEVNWERWKSAWRRGLPERSRHMQRANYCEDRIHAARRDLEKRRARQRRR